MLKKLFGFDPAKTTVKTEIIAGITTFLTMSYILAVNPSMFSELSMPVERSSLLRLWQPSSVASLWL